MLTAVFGSLKGDCSSQGSTEHSDSQLHGHEGTLGSQSSASWIRPFTFSSSLCLLWASSEVIDELQGIWRGCENWVPLTAFWQQSGMA